MRYNLISDFNEIRILNLHGSAKRDDAESFSGKDENVFDIMQGVTVFFLIKKQHGGDRRILYSEIFGTRDTKYKLLLERDIESIEWEELQPVTPYYLFVRKKDEGNVEYHSWYKLTDIFEVNSIAIQSSRDTLAFSFYENEMIERIGRLRNLQIPTEELRVQLKVKDMSFWKLKDARERVQADQEWKSRIRECLYRPFDKRFIVYAKDIIHRPREKVMKHFGWGDNIGLLCPRQLSSNTFQHVFCTNRLSEMCVISTKTKEQNYCFPLYTYTSDGRKATNLKSEFVEKLATSLKLSPIKDGSGDLKNTIGPYDIFAYIYAILHCPTYRSTNYFSLKYDFARIPISSNRIFFKQMRNFGDTLIFLHSRWEKIEPSQNAKFPKAGSNRIEVVDAILDQGENVDIVINYDDGKPAQLFRNIPKSAWDFKIGSYRVLEKWLNERKGRTLSFNELSSFQKIVASLIRTQQVMIEIDSVFRSEFKSNKTYK